MADFVDVRRLLAGYKWEDCPECGVTRCFRRVAPSRFETWDEHWLCETCSSRHRHIIEVACPTCEARMLHDPGRGRWVCGLCEDTREMDRKALIESMTGDLEPTGYDRGNATPCPVCGARYGVRTDPDGDRVCDDCEQYFVARFSDEWFAYAEWLEAKGWWNDDKPEWVRVTADGA